MIKIHIVRNHEDLPDKGVNSAYLLVDSWNDYAFVTQFRLYIFDDQRERHNIGNIKIGFRGQTTAQSTCSTLEKSFSALPEEYFS